MGRGKVEGHAGSHSFSPLFPGAAPAPMNRLFRMLRAAALITVLHPLSGCAAATVAADPAEGRFFATDDAALLALTADLGALEAGRREDDQHFRPGTLVYRGPNAGGVTRPVEVRVRGDSRRFLCDFPPLLIRFPGGPATGPVFGGHETLYHVGHCRSREPGFDVHVLREYLAYRIWSELSPVALRARPALIDYRDTGGRPDPGTRWAFLVEDRSRLARRLSGRFVDEPDSLDHDRIAVREAALLAVFQYLIGNTDWGIRTMHNVMILRTEDGVLHPVPFDFDFSGLVDAPYARPRRDLGLASVRERAYVGGCRPEAALRAALARVREARTVIHEASDALPGLEPAERAETRAYLTSFFRLLDDPVAVRREIVEACR